MNCLRGIGMVVLEFFVAGCFERNPKPVDMGPPTVQVAKPVEREVTAYQDFTARTQAVQQVMIKARVTGYLDKICFQDGDMVDKGDVLYEIDPRPYKAQLDLAKADLEYCKAAKIKAQADYDIGLNVQKQQKGAISEQELTKRLGARDEAVANVDKANAALEKAQLYYDWCKVTAPISGRLDRHFIDIGNLVTQDNSQLTNIVSLKPAWAYFDVDQNTVQKVGKLVAEGKLKSARNNEVPVEMTVGFDKVRVYQGTVDFVSNQLDPNTGSITVRGVFPNEDQSILAGMFGRVRVPVSDSHKALLVVDSAVGTNQSEKYILVVNDKDVVEYRIVQVGQVFDGLREIYPTRKVTEPGPDGKDVEKTVEVLKPGDRVIVSGLQRVRPDVKVAPKDVDMITLLPKK